MKLEISSMKNSTAIKSYMISIAVSARINSRYLGILTYNELFRNYQFHIGEGRNGL